MQVRNYTHDEIQFIADRLKEFLESHTEFSEAELIEYMRKNYGVPEKLIKDVLKILSNMRVFLWIGWIE